MTLWERICNEWDTVFLIKAYDDDDDSFVEISFVVYLQAL